jgi:hypothetical protein
MRPGLELVPQACGMEGCERFAAAAEPVRSSFSSLRHYADIIWDAPQASFQIRC